MAEIYLLPCDYLVSLITSCKTKDSKSPKKLSAFESLFAENEVLLDLQDLCQVWLAYVFISFKEGSRSS